MQFHHLVQDYHTHCHKPNYKNPDYKKFEMIDNSVELVEWQVTKDTVFIVISKAVRQNISMAFNNKDDELL